MKNAAPRKYRWWILACAFGGIVAIALTCGFFYLRYSIRREATLRLDLFVIRQAIQEYTLHKDHAPQSLQDLVSGHYLKEIPTDPFTRKKDWVPIISDTLASPDQTAAGIADVRSSSDRVGNNGIVYSLW